MPSPYASVLDESRVALCIWMMRSLSPTAIGVELPVLAPTVSDVAPTVTDAEVPGKYVFTIPPSVGCGPSAPGVPHVPGAAVASGTGPPGSGQRGRTGW